MWQDPPLDENLTVLDAVLAAPTPVMAAVREYERALALLDSHSRHTMGDPQGSGATSSDSLNGATGAGRGGGLSVREKEAVLQRAMEKVEALGAWDVASEAQKLLALLDVGFLDRKVGQCPQGASVLFVV